jgi:DNA-binding HxlR family transcriptional regulator
MAALNVPEVVGRPCSVAAALEIVGDRWSLLIVREVLFGNSRFSDIARNTGAPRDRLAARLKALVSAGILEQREYQSNPPRSDYHLTAAGRQLGPVLQVLREWGDKWAVDRAPVTVRHHDHELRMGRRCDVCGEIVRTGDLVRTMRVDGWDMAGPTV